MPLTVASSESLRRLSELLAPMAMADNKLRLFITGCRSGDGASTVAAAFAFDFSQRLALRTLLVDIHANRQALHRIFPRSSSRTPELAPDSPVRIRTTGWSCLELATCLPGTAEPDHNEALSKLNTIMSHYSVVVVDLGVARLDTRGLPLARTTDPVLIVVRYGHTSKLELATTASALTNAKRTVAGVILNATTRLVV